MIPVLAFEPRSDSCTHEEMRMDTNVVYSFGHGIYLATATSSQSRVADDCHLGMKLSVLLFNLNIFLLCHFKYKYRSGAGCCYKDEIRYNWL